MSKFVGAGLMSAPTLPTIDCLPISQAQFHLPRAPRFAQVVRTHTDEPKGSPPVPVHPE